MSDIPRNWLAQRRSRTALNQAQMAAEVRKRSGAKYSQQAYSKLEREENPRSVHMVTIIEILDEYDTVGLDADSHKREVKKRIIEKINAANEADLELIDSLIDGVHSRAKRNR